MRRITRTGFFLAAALFIFQGCGKNDPDAFPRVRYGLDVCADCRMIIAEPRFTAATVSDSREVLKFDDIGCAARHRVSTQPNPARLWVHDFLTEQWVDGKAAIFVYSENLVTPMGYGIAAFTDREIAQTFSEKEKGRLVSWEEILKIKKGE